MTKKIIPVVLDGLEIMVETVLLPGSEPTSSFEHASERLLKAFDTAEQTIVNLAKRVATVSGELARESTRPKELSVEFGLTFGSNGSIIVASASMEASLKVTLKYVEHGLNPEN